MGSEEKDAGASIAYLEAPMSGGETATTAGNKLLADAKRYHEYEFCLCNVFLLLFKFSMK